VPTTTVYRDTVDVLTGRRSLFYGWRVLIASIISMTVTSGLAAWANGLYVRPLEAEFGWSRAEVSLGFSAAILVSGLAGPLIGVWIDRRGPRSAIVFGSVFTALTYLLLASTQELWQWYLYSAVNAGFRQMMFFIPMQVLISRWFDRKRGAAMSIWGTGFSLGGFLTLPLLAFAIDATDWRGGFIFSAVLVVGVVLPIALFVLRDRPEDVGELPDGEPRPDTDEPPRPVWGLTLAQAVRRPLFWVLSIALMLYFFGAIGWMTHIVPFYESRGISRDTAAILLSISSGAGIAIRLAIGAYADRFERFEAPASAATALIAIGMALLLIEPGWGGVIAFTALWVIGTSVGPLVESLGLTRAFGLAHFATILGFVVVIETAGEVLSPSVTGAIFDSTDSYDLALVMYITTFALSSLLLAVAAKMRRPDPFAEA
jgi:sugar phosphate permease